MSQTQPPTVEPELEDAVPKSIFHLKARDLRRKPPSPEQQGMVRAYWENLEGFNSLAEKVALTSCRPVHRLYAGCSRNIYRESFECEWLLKEVRHCEEFLIESLAKMKIAFPVSIPEDLKDPKI